MRKFNCLAVTIVAILLAAPALAQDDILWRYARPDATMLLGLDWRKAKSSPAAEMLKKQFGQAAVSSSGSPLALEFLEQVDQVLLSTSGGVASLSGPGGKQAPMVAAIAGRIDRARLKKLMVDGVAVERWRGVDLLIPPKSAGSEAVMAIVSGSLALMGDRASIEEALSGQGGVRDAALFERARALASECEFWLAGTAPPSMPGSADPAMKQLEDVESMDLGVSLRNGFGLRVNLGMKSPESAQAMALMTQMTAGMMVNTPQSGEMAGILRGMKVNVEGNRLSMAIDMPLAAFERALRNVQSAAGEMGARSLESLIGAGAPSASRMIRTKIDEGPAPEGTVRIPAASPEPETRTIRIVGLEEGEREVKYQTPAPKPEPKKR
jgi:hypothetical protein